MGDGDDISNWLDRYIQYRRFGKKIEVEEKIETVAYRMKILREEQEIPKQKELIELTEELFEAYDAAKMKRREEYDATKMKRSEDYVTTPAKNEAIIEKLTSVGKRRITL